MLFLAPDPRRPIKDQNNKGNLINDLKKLFGGGLGYILINKQSTNMQGQRVLFLRTFVLTMSGKAVGLWYTLIVSNVSLQMRAISNDVNLCIRHAIGSIT